VQSDADAKPCQHEHEYENEDHEGMPQRTPQMAQQHRDFPECLAKG
jgi:hypothetical protein